MTEGSDNKFRFSWVLQIVVAAILGQTLFFKFSGAEESRALFEVFDADPWGRIASGAAEAVAVVLLLIPGTAAFGAIFSLGVIVPAIVLHLTTLGVSIDPEALGDPRLEPLAGPSMFVMAMIVLLGSLGVLLIRRGQVAALLGRNR